MWNIRITDLHNRFMRYEGYSLCETIIKDYYPYCTLSLITYSETILI